MRVGYNNLLLYEHQWNTRWAVVRKLDIFICENNMLASHVKISPLLWLHNKSLLSHQKTIKVKWLGSSLPGRLGIRNFSSCGEKIFHSFSVLTREIFFNTHREISYLCAPEWKNCFIKNAHKVWRILPNFICKNNRFSACF